MNPHATLEVLVVDNGFVVTTSTDREEEVTATYVFYEVGELTEFVKSWAQGFTEGGEANGAVAARDARIPKGKSSGT
jgi:hypothetical protein